MKKQLKFKDTSELDKYMADLVLGVENGDMEGAQASIWKWDALVANPELAILANWSSFCGLCMEHEYCDGCPIHPCAMDREDWLQMVFAETPDEWLKGARKFRARIKRELKANSIKGDE